MTVSAPKSRLTAGAYVRYQLRGDRDPIREGSLFHYVIDYLRIGPLADVDTFFRLSLPAQLRRCRRRTDAVLQNQSGDRHVRPSDVHRDGSRTVSTSDEDVDREYRDSRSGLHRYDDDRRRSVADGRCEPRPEHDEPIIFGARV